jgi:hypothetical protein
MAGVYGIQRAISCLLQNTFIFNDLWKRLVEQKRQNEAILEPLLEPPPRSPDLPHRNRIALASSAAGSALMRSTRSVVQRPFRQL